MGLEQLGMMRESIVVAPAKINQPPAKIEHLRGPVRLDGFGQTHGLGGVSSFRRMPALSSA